jgi:hypothetical protein
MDSDLGFNKYDLCFLINLPVHGRGVGAVRTYGEARELLRDRDKLLLLLLLLRPVTGVVPPKRERATDLDEPWFSNEEFGVAVVLRFYNAIFSLKDNDNLIQKCKVLKRR